MHVTGCVWLVLGEHDRGRSLTEQSVGELSNSQNLTRLAISRAARSLLITSFVYPLPRMSMKNNSLHHPGDSCPAIPTPCQRLVWDQ